MSDAEYSATDWNGVTTLAPSKNAVRDKIEAVVAALASPAAHYLTDQAEGSLSAEVVVSANGKALVTACLLYTSPSPRDRTRPRMPSSA